MWFFLDLYQKGVALPCPVKMLGGLDLEDEEEYDVEDTICLRQTEEYGTFLYLFLKSVVPAATMRDRCQNFLLSAYVTVNLEAYAILTYVNRSVHYNDHKCCCWGHHDCSWSSPVRMMLCCRQQWGWGWCVKDDVLRTFCAVLVCSCGWRILASGGSGSHHSSLLSSLHTPLTNTPLLFPILWMTSSPFSYDSWLVEAKRSATPTAISSVTHVTTHDETATTRRRYI